MNQEVKIQNALDFKRILDGMDEAMLAKAHVSISAPARFAGSFVVEASLARKNVSERWVEEWELQQTVFQWFKEQTNEKYYCFA